MKKTWLSHGVMTFILLAMGMACAAALNEDQPVSVFADLDGTWRGTFVGYDQSGREIYRIMVEQTYETVNDTTQRVTVKDVMPDRTVITGRGHNSAKLNKDGSLTLRCVIQKSNGDRVEHDGRIVKGPDGMKQLIWYTSKPGRIETFREEVRKEGEGTFYMIHGMGQYGGNFMLMTGRYKKEF